MKINKCIVVVLLLFCISCEHSECKSARWHLIYKNDYKGNTLFGDKRELINAVRMGHPIRIGFGGHRSGDTTLSIEHIMEGEFISIANGEDVFAQTSPAIAQKPYLEKDPVTIDLVNSHQFSWIIGTNGSMSSLSVDFKIDSLKTPSSSRRGFYWYVNAPISQKEYDNLLLEYPEPFWKNPREPR